MTQERWSFYTAYDRFECCILTVIGVEQLATGETWQRRLNSDYGEYKDLGTLTNACLKGLITRIKGEFLRRSAYRTQSLTPLALRCPRAWPS